MKYFENTSASMAPEAAIRAGGPFLSGGERENCENVRTLKTRER